MIKWFLFSFVLSALVAKGALIWRPQPALAAYPAHYLQQTPAGQLTGQSLYENGKEGRHISIEGKGPTTVAWWNSQWWALIPSGQDAVGSTLLYRSPNRIDWHLVHEMVGRPRRIYWDDRRLLVLAAKSASWVKLDGSVHDAQVPTDIQEALFRFDSAALGPHGVVIALRLNQSHRYSPRFLKVSWSGSTSTSNAPEHCSDVVWFRDRYVAEASDVVWTSSKGIKRTQSVTLTEGGNSARWHVSAGGGRILISTSSGVLWWGDSLDRLKLSRIPPLGQNYDRLFFDGERHWIEGSSSGGRNLVDLANPETPRVRRFSGDEEALSMVHWNGQTFISFPSGTYLRAQNHQEWFLHSFPAGGKFTFCAAGDTLAATGTIQNASGGSSTVFLRSTNGRDWDEIPLDAVSSPNELVRAANAWWIRGYSNNLWRSVDGAVFAPVEVPSQLLWLIDLQDAFGELVALAATSDGSHILGRTTNGSDWTLQSLPTADTSRFNRIVGDDDELFAFSGWQSVGNSPAGLWRSFDGSEWSQVAGIDGDVSALAIAQGFYTGAISYSHTPALSGFVTRDFGQSSTYRVHGMTGSRLFQLSSHTQGFLANTNTGIHWLTDYAHYWRTRNFSDDVAATADDADPDNDGHSNLLERLLATDPLTPSNPRVVFRQGYGTGNEDVVETNLIVSLYDLEYLNVETSTDMLNWTMHPLQWEAGSSVLEETQLGLVWGTAPWFVRVSASGSPPLFFPEE